MKKRNREILGLDIPPRQLKAAGPTRRDRANTVNRIDAEAFEEQIGERVGAGVTSGDRGMVDGIADQGHARLGISLSYGGDRILEPEPEGFVIESLLAAVPERTVASFYRTAAGAEIDLLLEIPGHGAWAIEIKSGLSSRPEKGFHIACEDVRSLRRFLVNAGHSRYPLSADLDAISVTELSTVLTALQSTIMPSIGALQPDSG